jgi:thymidine phosphorylase
MDRPAKYLKGAPFVKDFIPAQKFRVSAVDARAIGIGIVELGGGRARPTDTIDHSVGLTHVAQIGEEVGGGGKPLATIHAKDEAGYKHMCDVLSAAMTAGKGVAANDLIKLRIAA